MERTEEKTIVIGGGVGPMAGVELHKKIIEQTLTDGTDQSHLEILHLSRSPYIPDRTEFLLGNISENPAEGMLLTFQIASQALRTAAKPAVGGIPCNTFHAPRIFNSFIQLLDSNHIAIDVLNMPEETVRLIGQVVPAAARIGLMSTTGTRTVGVYRQALEAKGLEVIEVPERLQPGLHDSIYNREWGVKAVSPVTPRARANFTDFARSLIEKGAQAIILGCTEIPLALPGTRIEGVPLIDPVFALARALVREANSKKLKPLR